MTRGIVIGSKINTDNGFSMSGAVDIQDVLKWLLYWDHITYTGIGSGGGSITGNHPADILFLESAGIFKTEIVDIATIDHTTLPPAEPGMQLMGLAGNQFATASAAARVQLSKQLTKSTGNIWTIGQSGGEQLLLPGSNKSVDLIDVQLINCLPVPKLGTSFEDSLEFKLRYKDELEELRHSLDGLRENILSSSDEERATINAVNKISSSISNIRSALNGKGVDTFSDSLSLYTNNPAIGFWTSIGGISAAAIGFPVDVGLATGIAAPTIIKFLQRSIKGGSSLSDNNSEFAYVYETIKELE